VLGIEGMALEKMGMDQDERSCFLQNGIMKYITIFFVKKQEEYFHTPL
jgi:hypothetical protein